MMFDLAGSLLVAAPRLQVWRLLTDVDSLKPCIPGLESLVVVEPEREFHGVLRLNLGRQQARRLPVVVWWESMVAPSSGRVRARTRLAERTVEWHSTMALTAGAPGETELRWSVSLTMPGAAPGMARLTASFLQPIVEKGTRAYLACLRERAETLARMAAADQRSDGGSVEAGDDLGAPA